MELTKQQIEELAKQMYDDCLSVKPNWDQLGAVTQSVWINKALEQLKKEAE